MTAWTPSRAVVVPPVEIDYGTADDFALEISQAFASGATTVAIDFSAVTFCDSIGLRVLVHAAKRARASGATFVILAPTRPLLRLADILQASDLLGLPPPAK